jgi:hypothetical protein
MSIHAFIVEAKASCYVGGSGEADPSRIGSSDLAYEKGPFSYRDSYFGGTDFIGQEVVWENGLPIWAMNYYGRIDRDDLMSGADIVHDRQMRPALGAMHRQGRFLGGFCHEIGKYRHVAAKTGDCTKFTGEERNVVDGEAAYRLDYQGGLIRA